MPVNKVILLVFIQALSFSIANSLLTKKAVFKAF